MNESMANLRAGVRRLGLGGWVAVLMVVAAVLAPTTPVVRFARSLFTPNPPAPSQPGDPKKNAEQRATEFGAMLAQLNGRTLMRTPAPPSSATAEARVDDGPPTPPPPPTKYEGPTIIGMVNNTVWFSDGTRRGSDDQAKDDLKVVRTNPPWDATVSWKGVEFKVELFPKNYVVYKDKDESDTTPRVQAAPFEPAPEKPAPKKEEPKKDEAVPVPVPPVAPAPGGSP